MNCNREHFIPAWWSRIYSVWYRHRRVYTSDFVSNAFPPFLEPLIFLGGLGIGFGAYIQVMGTVDYLLYLASGIVMISAMYTASFECTYGTYIRLEFDRVYDGMLGAPISPTNLIVGEIIFAGSKGLFFSLAVLIVIWLLGIITHPLSILAALVGFVCGLMFGTLSMWITSIVKNINHFNFYFTGFIAPMFFFSGAVFPLENLPRLLQYAAEILPLTHAVRLARAFCIPELLGPHLFYDVAYCVIFIALTGWLAIRGIGRRLVD